jgi:Double-GTPase 2
MQFVVFLLLVIAGAIALALYVCYIAASGLLAAVVAIAVYGLALPVGYLATLGQVLALRPAGLPPPERWPQPSEGDDPAVPQYFYGPALADARHAVTVAYQRSREWWGDGARRVRSALDSDLLLATVPPGIGGAIGMGVGAAVGALLAAGCAAVYLLVVAVCTAGVRVTGAVLRGIDSGLLRIKNIRIHCPNCGERVPYPGYVCPGPKCRHRHQDVRPGRFGIIRRSCRCGTRMKTLLLFGSAQMTAFCPRCGTLWQHSAGTDPEMVLAFFGATGAGKTRLVSAMITQLMSWATPGELCVEPADQATAGSLQGAADVLHPDRATPVTPVQLPRSLLIRVSTGKVTHLLHHFDAAGEHYQDVVKTEGLLFLGSARTFILVINPLPILAAWRRPPDGRPAEPAQQPPDAVYHRVYQQIQAMRVPLNEARLAVVFSHADLMPACGADVAEWACRELGLSNLVRSTRQNFKEVRFFRTAAVTTEDGTVHRSIAVLLRWVVAGSGLTLPGEDDDRPT